MSPRYSGVSPRFGLAALALLASLAPGLAQAQLFTEVVDPANPVASASAATTSYAGAAWVDVDGDADLDLFVATAGLFRNTGGTFVAEPGALRSPSNAKGVSWADMDNDGDIDVFIAGGAPQGSAWYRNLGGGAFERILGPVFADSLVHSGWGCAWGDYDGNGFVDLVVAAPNGFAGINHVNRLFRNTGGMLTREDTTNVTAALAPYTVPSWSDYDNDGDLDLAIASGPANGSTAPDFHYRNRRESKPGWLQRITTGVLATDPHDGQLYNWIDYDNDGDLDTYLTNYGAPAGRANNLYRNNGNDTFTRLGLAFGSIVSDIAISLASVWGDFDNDGDLDCLVTNDGAFTNNLYLNNGNGTFSSAASPVLTSEPGPHHCATAGDYDEDGDLDLYVSGAGTKFGLFRANAPAANHWVKFALRGVQSNRTAIGAKVRIKATINGAPVWQMREISSQNSFNGHSAYDVHFGLGNASVIDSVRIEWPSGIESARTGVAVDTRHVMIEDVATAAEASLVSSEVRGGTVRLEWRIVDADQRTLELERRMIEADWQVLGTVHLDGRDRAVYEDSGLPAGSRVGYRLVAIEAGSRRAIGETWIEIPVTDAFGIRALSANPGRGPLELEFTLQGPGRAEIEMVDVQGRRVALRAFPSPEPGRHTVRLGADGLSPGVYLVRLSQGQRIATAKAVIVR